MEYVLPEIAINFILTIQPFAINVKKDFSEPRLETNVLKPVQNILILILLPRCALMNARKMQIKKD